MEWPGPAGAAGKENHPTQQKKKKVIYESLKSHESFIFFASFLVFSLKQGYSGAAASKNSNNESVYFGCSILFRMVTPTYVNFCLVFFFLNLSPASR